MSIKISNLFNKYKIILIIIGLLIALPFIHYIILFIYMLGRYFGIFIRNIYEIVTTFL